MAAAAEQIEAAADATQAPEPEAGMRFHVAAGTYEHMIYGVEFHVEPDEEGCVLEEMEVEKRFSYEPHGATLTALGAAGKLLVSGSADELLKVYDTKRLVEVGTLMLHEGTVTSLDFYGDTHMLSGSEDGAICIWDIRTWDNLKVMHGHQGRVNDVAIHPSGRLAVSVGQDRTLRTWNLLKGRSAFTSARRTAAQLVLWTQCGQSVIVAEEKAIQILPLSEGGPQGSITCGFYVSSMKLLRDDRLAVVGHHSDIHVYDIADAGKLLTRVTGHSTPRVKCLAVSSRLSDAGDEMMVSADSSGILKFWAVGPDSVNEFGEVQVGGRVTCLAISLPDHCPEKKAKKKKQKKGGGAAGDKKKGGGAVGGKKASRKRQPRDVDEGASRPSDAKATAGKRQRKKKTKPPTAADEGQATASVAPKDQGTGGFEVVDGAATSDAAHITQGLPAPAARVAKAKRKAKLTVGVKVDAELVAASKSSRSKKKSR